MWNAILFFPYFSCYDDSKLKSFFFFLFDAPHVIAFSDHHKHTHSEEEEETKEQEEIPAWKKQALEKEKTHAGDPMAMNWNVDQMEE
jgi:hypothetical protein